jgi:hypothetical protein
MFKNANFCYLVNFMQPFVNDLSGAVAQPARLDTAKL